MNFLFPYAHLWFLPSWKERARIVIGLLEFTLTAYQHGALGTFYMCNLSETDIGYTMLNDVKLQHITGILSRQQLHEQLSSRACSNDSDCRYTDQCIGVCDFTSRTCTANITKPNLSHVCSLIKQYIVKGAPRFLLGDLLHILDKCEHLHHDQDKLDLNHSLILNDLKLLLWKQISNS